VGRLAVTGGHGILGTEFATDASRVDVDTIYGPAALLNAGSHVVIQRHGLDQFVSAPLTIASECVLAGELGLAYAGICVVDNLANGVSDAPLTVEEIPSSRPVISSPTSSMPRRARSSTRPLWRGRCSCAAV
jgi:hypothetical protein